MLYSSHSWHFLAQTLVQHHLLRVADAERLLKAEPSHSLAWLQLYLSQNNQGFTGSSLADALAKIWSIKRLSLSELEFLLQQETIEPKFPLTTWPQGVLWLGGSPSCIGVLDASSLTVLQRIEFLVSQPIEWRILSVDEYCLLVDAQSGLLDGVARFSLQKAPEKIESKSVDLTQQDNEQAPIIQYLFDLMAKMVGERASDLHFEPFAHHYRIRARIDGVLHDVAAPDISLKERLSVRLKVMAQLDIADKRVPQDGRMKLTLPDGRVVDCRVSSLPTLFGEKIVVRFLNSHISALDLSILGYEPEQQALLESVLTYPHGLILMTGPTGSGKTVSLYACLSRLNKMQINISTVEDPVEIFMDGINQISINEKAGLYFSTVLRAFLRQDPDVLMVGEIRDLETADIALKAAQTGHLVFSTLHTKDAPSALTRLAQIGVASYNIAASVTLVVAQRLVRTLCSCKRKAYLDKHLLLSAGFQSDDAAQIDWHPYVAVGCVKCHQSGYIGRIGVFQLLPMTTQMQSFVARGADGLSLNEQAVCEGVLTLRQAGLRKVKSGLCSLEEIMAATL